MKILIIGGAGVVGFFAGAFLGPTKGPTGSVKYPWIAPAAGLGAAWLASRI